MAITITQEEAVLAILKARQDGATTVEIYEALARAIKNVTLGAIYVTVDRLKKKGLLTRTKSEPRPEQGGRAQFVYTLSALGQATYLRNAAQIKRVWEEIEAVGAI
jgi:Fe2+ or Zn2+ uptake regulation protein